MNSEEQSQDFEKLQRLLKLKRYEQPPPRYFNDFSTQVIGHIRADTSIRRFEKADDLISRSPWLRRLWRKLENQPGLTGALATVVCGVMVAGVFLMEETPAHTINFTAVGDGPVNHEPAPAGTGLSENFATVATALCEQHQPAAKSVSTDIAWFPRAWPPALTAGYHFRKADAAALIWPEYSSGKRRG
jgi:hypothetical protein